MVLRAAKSFRSIILQELLLSGTHAHLHARISSHVLRIWITLSATVLRSCFLTRCSSSTRAATHPELLHAVVDTALVLVDVGPGVAGGAKGGNIALRGLGDAVELHEQTHGEQLRSRGRT